MNSTNRSHTGAGFGTMVSRPQAIKTVYVCIPSKETKGTPISSTSGKRVYKQASKVAKINSQPKNRKKKGKPNKKKRKTKISNKRSKVTNF